MLSTSSLVFHSSLAVFIAFEQDFTKALFIGYHCVGFGQPQFEITFDKGRVVRVRRLFIDGAGCNIEGPILSSKKQDLLLQNK